MRDEELYNVFGRQRISERQLHELIGLARGVVADGALNHAEAEFLQKWLAANVAISGQPLIRTLYNRVNEILGDGVLDADEARELFDTLGRLSDCGIELGEALKSTSLPLCAPPPDPMAFVGRSYCFTGTFNYGGRKACEGAVVERGASCGSLTRKTDFLVIGVYATESWKHSAFGNKILRAVEMRDGGVPISIVSEEHWTRYL